METYILDATFIQSRIQDEKDFEAMCRKAMNASFDSSVVCWSVSDDDKFKAACGALLMAAKSKEDKEWIKNQVEALQKLNLFITAAQGGMAPSPEVFSDLPKNDRKYTLMSMFQEAKKKDEDKFKRMGLKS
ncbi:MAG: hypothetical protein V1792_23410 [Pseudomonadota bacterium]